jgi:trimeric autotransporter adhesin
MTGDSITCGTTLTGGSSVCGTGTNASNAYWSTAVSSTTNTYIPAVYGIPGAFVQQQIAYAPTVYDPLCVSSAGRSIATLFEGTNNFLTVAQTYSFVASLEAAWVSTMKAAGCRTILISPLSRQSTDGVGTTYDTDIIGLAALMRNLGVADAFIDMGTDPAFGAVGAYANPSALCSGGNCFNDGIHPSAAGHVRIGLAIACAVNALDGSSPAAMNQIAITATSGTLACADGGRNFNAVGGSINWTLPTAMYQTGRKVRYCNITPSGSNTVTLTAPSDFPFNNVSGATTKTISAGACLNLEATWNGLTTSSTGAFWKTF